MIFVAVGTQKFPLDRLLKQIDELVGKEMISEEIFAQIGYSDYQPIHYASEKFLSKEEFERRVEFCDILITHSGVGTIMAGLKKEKKVIVFPRLSKYGEHVDDHQLEIAESFAEKNYVLMCSDIDDLEKVLCQAVEHDFSVYVSNREEVIGEIRSFVDLL